MYKYFTMPQSSRILKILTNKGIPISTLREKYKYLVLYFYPKDNTPGCTTEAIEFTNLKRNFEKLGTTIIGVSRDSEESHKRFIEKHNLGITIVSDTNQELIKLFDVLKLKKRFGKEYYGVVRSTFLIDLQKGKVIQEWRNVRAKGHAREVLEYILGLNK